jgi:hypothetical protein
MVCTSMERGMRSTLPLVGQFGYADLGSSCCPYYPVAILGPRTLRVRFEPVNEGQPGCPMRGVSVWGGRHGPKDWTSVIRLRGLPT